MRVHEVAAAMIVMVVILVAVSLSALYAYLQPRVDQTVRYETGAFVFIDENGCQYLTRDGGGYQPRLDKTGKQICE